MLKILIIDDDSFLADLYRNLFEAAGFWVEVSSDGKEGCSRVIEMKPDAVLLDLMLNTVSGIEVLETIRARPEFQHLPIIAYSNVSEVSLFKLARGAGATRLFCKGSSKPSEIVAAIVTACAATRLPATG